MCAACGRQEPNNAFRFCLACGTPLAANPTWLLRANLDFVLGEIRAEKTAGRLPGALADQLAADYAKRRAVLDAPPPPVRASGAIAPASPVSIPPAAAAAPPVPASAPPMPQRPNALAAFLQANNIAALHLIGALLLLTGLVLLVVWQWGTPLGKGLLLAVLLALGTGFSLGGRRMGATQPISALVLSALGALILPLNPVAWNAVGLFGFRPLPWNLVGFATATVCTGLYALTLWRTRHPLFAAFVVVAGACAARFGTSLLPGAGAGFVADALAFVPVAALFFAFAGRARRGQKVAGAETSEDPAAWPVQPFLVGGHALMLVTLARTFGPWSSVWQNGSPAAAALVLAGAAGVYGAAAVLLGVPLLASAAALAVVGAGQFLLPPDATLLSRAAVGTVCALLLELVARLHQKRGRAGEQNSAEETWTRIARTYATAAAGAAGLAVLPALFTLTTGYANLRPPVSARVLVPALVSLAGTAGLFASVYGRERRRATLGAALGLGAFALAAVLLLVLPRGSAAWGRDVAGVPLLLFAALTVVGASLLRRRPRPDQAAAGVFDGAALACAALAALLPWAYLLAGANTGAAFGAAQRGFVLPGTILLGALAAFARRFQAADQRDAFVHLTALAFGSLALFCGATGPLVSVPGLTHTATRLLVTVVLGGASAVLVGVLSLNGRALRSVLAFDAALLAGVASATAVLATLLLPGPGLLAAGTWLLLALAWTLAATGGRRPVLLYLATGTGLIATRIAAGVLADWGAQQLAWEPNAARWLLLTVPIFALAGRVLRQDRNEYARPLYHAALAAVCWTALEQTSLPLLGGAGIVASPALTLYLVAAGLAACGALAQRTVFVGASLAAAGAGYGTFWLSYQHGHGFGAPAGITALVLIVLGAAYLWTAWEHDAPAFAGAGGLALFAGWAHAALLLLPSAIQAGAWPLAFAPVFVLLFALAQWLGRDAGANGQRRSLDRLALGLPLACFAVFVLSGFTFGSAVVAGRAGWLAAATVVYGLLFGLAAWRRADEPAWGHAGAIVATLGGLLCLGGWPHFTLPAARAGFVLTLFAGGWLGVAALVALVHRYTLAEAMTQATLGAATIGVAWALAGVADPGQGRWTVFALVVAGGVYAVVGMLRGQSAWAHAAAGSWFAAFALFLYDGVGLSVHTADFYLIPVGVYLCVVGALVGRARPDAAGRAAAQRLYALGLALALAPTFLAAVLDTAWWHAFLLVAECVLAVYVGIARRTKVFLGVGTAFLVALLGAKLRAPLGQINFGVYLTLLGLLVLGSAYLFERRREAVRGWVQATREAFGGWE